LVEPARATPYLDSTQISRAARLRAQAITTAAIDAGRCFADWTGVNSCGITYSASPTGYHCAETGTCRDLNWLTQRDPINVVFAKPVYGVVIGGGGAYFCPGTFGSITGSNAHGDVVEQSDFIVKDPADCGPDNVTGGVVDTLKFSGGISHVVIQPPSPWEFDECSPNGCIGHASAGYEFYFFDKRPPTATSCLTGDGLLDQEAMRQLLDSLWKLAGGDAPVNDKVERGGYLLEDSTGVVRFLISDLDPNANACGTSNTPSNIPPKSTVLASVHVHPFQDGASTEICHPGTPGWYDGRHNLGFSLKKTDPASGRVSGDLAALESLAGFPGMEGLYIIDHDQISFAPVGATNKNITTKGKSNPRVQSSGCRVA
jgi:hypothetical protein